MSRESEFAAARMRHSVWSERFDDVMSTPIRNTRLTLGRKTVALICADRAEKKMDAFLKSCLAEYGDGKHADS